MDISANFKKGKKIMKKQKQLTEKQINLLNDLFESGKSEIEVLKEHRISAYVYRRWLNENQLFADEFTFRIQAGKRQCERLIASYAPAAAAKLIELTQGEKEETTRKACLDIISLPLELSRQTKKPSPPKPTTEDISEKLASRILKALADDTEKQ